MPPPQPETLAQAVARVRVLPPGAPEPQRLATIFGVVLDCSLPRPSRGSDHVVNLRIIDDSAALDPSLAGGVELIVFARDAGAMPQAAAPADIIRCANVVVQFWAGRTQLLGQMTPGRPFSYLMFSGAAGAPDAPYRLGGGRAAAAAARQVAPEDAARLAQLRAMAAKRALSGEDEPTARYLRKVMDLTLPPVDEAASALLLQQQQQQQQQQPGWGQQPPVVHAAPEVLDMRCKVLAIDRRDAAEPVLFVWDSTDARPMPCGLRLKPSVFRGQVELRAGERHRVLPLLPGATGVEVAEDLPPLGTALPVVVLQPRGQPLRPLPAVGEWVKLKVVGLQLHQGQLALVTGTCSRVTPAAGDPHIDTALAARLGSGDVAAFAQRPLTRCPRHLGLPLVTVRQVLQQRLDGVSATFRLLVRITSHLPSDAAALCRPSPRGPAGAWSYAAKLALEDATGRLDALLLGAAGEELLGVAACDPARRPEQAGRLRAALARLAHIDARGVARDGEGCAWLEVVLSSCYSGDAAAAAAQAEAIALQAADGGGDDGGGGGGDAPETVSPEAGAALAAPAACIYLIHDTLLA